MAHHKDLTGADLHEPKGAASASAGEVYVADGAGSGDWNPQAGSFVALTRTITDVSTAGDVRLSSPVAGDVVYITAVLEGALSVADSIVSFHVGAVSIDTADLTISSAGVAGSQYNSTPTGHNGVAVGDVIKITTDGGSTGTAVLVVTLLIDIG